MAEAGEVAIRAVSAFFADASECRGWSAPVYLAAHGEVNVGILEALLAGSCE